MKKYLHPALCFIISCVTPAVAQTPDEVLIGPIEYKQDVNGVPVNLIASTYVKLVTVDNKIYLRARLIGDLSDLQKQIGRIVDTFSLPKDNCASYNPKNLVVDIPRKEMIARDHDALFSISGSVAVWHCLENPIPKTKLDFEVRNVGFGIKTKVPVIISWPGDPIKNKLVTQSFDANLQISLQRKDSQTIALQIGAPDINLRGDLAFILNSALIIAGVNINDKAKDALEKAIDPQKLVVTIPEEVKKYNPVIDNAELSNKGGHLSLELQMSALVPADAINEMVKALLDKDKEKEKEN